MVLRYERSVSVPQYTVEGCERGTPAKYGSGATPRKKYPSGDPWTNTENIRLMNNVPFGDGVPAADAGESLRIALPARHQRPHPNGRAGGLDRADSRGRCR